MAQILLLFLFVKILTSAKHWSPYMEACHKDDPDYSKCEQYYANSAIPYLIKGDKVIGVSSLNPMIIPEAVVEKGKDFKLKMTNVSMYGIDTLRKAGGKTNFTTLEGNQDYTMDRLSFVGNYEVDGKILSLPISGKGLANVTLVKPIFHLNWTMNWTIKDGVKSLTLVKAASSYDVDRVIYQIDNLFNGNKELGDNMNKALNKNWQVLHDEFGANFARIIMSTMRNNTLRVINSVSFDEIFQVWVALIQMFEMKSLEVVILTLQ